MRRLEPASGASLTPAPAERPAWRRGVVLVVAGAVLVLSWSYLLWMDWGMRHMDRGADMLLMPRMVGWGALDLMLVFVMWAVMMAAMMLPSAMPAIVLYGRARGNPARFAAGYLLAWFVFSALATLLQWRLLEAALVTPMMVSASPRLSAGLLIVAGLYQLTPLKDACLARCRTPLGAMLSGLARPSRPIAEGFRNGLYCVGCCAAIMLVLFAVGVMSLPWVLLIAAYVTLEKLAPRTIWLPRAAGVVLCLWGVFLLNAARS
jgi:predicted metal-binding membrane protein